MKDFLRKLIPDQHPIRLQYHKWKAIAAAFIYRFPAEKMTVIAVTGTNGKTTVCNYLHGIFMEAGMKTGILTTVNFRIGEHLVSNLNKQTTLSPFMMQRKLRQMLDSGCEVVVIEATSHAMVQSRLWGVNVDTAVFTNLSQDHLSYHGTMESYADAKAMLFEQLNTQRRKAGIPKLAVINQDDAVHEEMKKFPVDGQFLYGLQRGIYGAKNLQMSASGTVFTFKVPNGEEEINFNIPGEVNVYNALAAATTAFAHKIDLKTIKAALEKMQPVSGRIESVDAGQPFAVIVDYAHTEDSLEKLLTMFKEISEGRIILVFGATGGGRDQDKRPKMGAVAHKYADIVIVTNDDVYEEDPNEIAEMVREGIPREEGDNFWQILDRKEAIHLALSLAKENDTVLIAGKGGEEVIVIGKDKIPYDDRKVVREILARPVDIDVPISLKPFTKGSL